MVAIVTKDSRILIIIEKCQPGLSKKDGLRCRVRANVNTYRRDTWGTSVWELKQQHGLSFVVMTDHFFDKLVENWDG